MSYITWQASKVIIILLLISHVGKVIKRIVRQSSAYKLVRFITNATCLVTGRPRSQSPLKDLYILCIVRSLIIVLTFPFFGVALRAALHRSDLLTREIVAPLALLGGVCFIRFHLIRHPCSEVNTNGMHISKGVLI